MMAKKKKIVLVNQSAGYLFIDIANRFANEYDEVVLLAGEVVPMNQPLHAQVKVRSIYRYQRGSTIKRIFSWLIGTLQILGLLIFRYRQHEILLSSNPPLASSLIPALLHRRIVLLIYDIYPDGLAAAKFIQPSNLIYRGWAGLNKRAYQRVIKIITLTPGMASGLSAYVNPQSIEVIPAWSSMPEEKPAPIIPTDNLFLKEYQLADKFIIMYSGNLGKEYNLKPLIAVAERLKNYPEMHFIIMGKGWQRDELAQLIKDKALTNIQLLPYQPADRFTHVLQAYHVGIVSLAEAVAKIAIPSKTYNLLAAHRPIVCVGNEHSDLANFLQTNEIGAAIDPADLDKLTNHFLKLYQDKAYYHHQCAQAAKISGDYTSQRSAAFINLFSA